MALELGMEWEDICKGITMQEAIKVSVHVVMYVRPCKWVADKLALALSKIQ